MGPEADRWRRAKWDIQFRPARVGGSRRAFGRAPGRRGRRGGLFAHEVGNGGQFLRRGSVDNGWRHLDDEPARRSEARRVYRWPQTTLYWGMGDLSPRIRFELQDAFGKDFEIEIDLEYDPYQKAFLGIKLENEADKDGWHVYITRLNPKKLFYQKLLELEETLPSGDKMMTPFKIKLLTITQGMTQIYQGTGPSQEMRAHSAHWCPRQQCLRPALTLSPRRRRPPTAGSKTWQRPLDSAPWLAVR